MTFEVFELFMQGDRSVEISGLQPEKCPIPVAEYEAMHGAHA
ncbi:hypothetical protein [Roseovarius sp. ZX-A-9]|nr:hypothetical protein [Roseovarius sp. ZX-A-9]